MSGPAIMPITRDITGAMINAPTGFVVSVYHHPSGRSLYGFEKTSEDALGWLRASRLVLENPEGSA